MKDIIPVCNNVHAGTVGLSTNEANYAIEGKDARIVAYIVTIYRPKIIITCMVFDIGYIPCACMCYYYTLFYNLN